jgi:hypothetical protein
VNDDELCALLSEAFSPEDSRPPPDSVAALRRAVATTGSAGRRLAGRRRIAVAAATLALLSAGSGTAFAVSGVPLPEPLRVVAHGIGLPVDSVALADTRTVLGRLKFALKLHEVQVVREDAGILQTRLAHLHLPERREVSHEAADLLGEANQEGAESQFGQQGPETSPPAPTPTTTPPPATTTPSTNQTSIQRGPGGDTQVTSTTHPERSRSPIPAERALQQQEAPPRLHWLNRFRQWRYLTIS